MRLPWVSRSHFDEVTAAIQANVHTYRDLYMDERKRSADLTTELLSMRKHGFEIVDTTVIEQPPSVDEQDAIAAAKDSQ